MYYTLLKYIFSLFLLFLSLQDGYSIPRKLLKDLKGKWKFSIGERDEWSRKDFDDSSWDEIKVPERWEEQGFHGYNGYAFYRKTICIPDDYEGHLFFLELGYIDDVDQVYFNGILIGSTGSFPPDYTTAYDAKREYYIPGNIISYDGHNVIAVKVFDNYKGGGIISGKPGLYVSKTPMFIDIHLSGFWKFKADDDPSFKDSKYNDNDWDEILVPSEWENQGYKGYDGFGWYRKTFNLTKTIKDEKIVVLLGKIDDVDEAYLNGNLIGGTGDIEDSDDGDYWRSLRGYLVSKDLLNRRKNVIAVRVYDDSGDGGIYEGPVGIISQKKYIEYWHKRRR